MFRLMTVKINKVPLNLRYSPFDQLDGEHPWATLLPEGCILYPVRMLNKGKAVYFNFALAKEMGLLQADHPHKMNPDLEKKILETFSIQIINEYDELTKKRFPTHTLKKNKYMATRYLQLQHSNKQGKTSGDGRGIWNGIVNFQGQTWDISSRGTGVTSLSPGAVVAQKPLKTGAGEYGYGCGLAEIDELLSASIFAEMMHYQGIPTERVLCIIDLGNGHGIGVRAALNLVRPAHLFLYLKQSRLDELKRGTDYLIDRQIKNKRWKIDSKINRYDQALNIISKSFAEFSAKLETDYIFAWLDWDGDNVLADAGIIDYGSIRQFGLCHDKYRYDDVERFSTTLNQQKSKAMLIVKLFAQMFDYIKTGNKKKLNLFDNHSSILLFKTEFHKQRLLRFLFRLGFNETQRNSLYLQKPSLEEFYQMYRLLEVAKTNNHYKKVADGINIFPLYNLRKLILRFNELILKESPLTLKDIIHFGLAQKSKRAGRKKAAAHFTQFKKLFLMYKKMLKTALPQKPQFYSKDQAELFQRSLSLNSPLRVTGNALIEIVEMFWKKANSANSPELTQNTIDYLISQYLFLPEGANSHKYAQNLKAPQKLPMDAAELQKIILTHNEDI